MPSKLKPGDLVKKKDTDRVGLIVSDEYSVDAPRKVSTKGLGLYQVLWSDDSTLESLVPEDTLELWVKYSID